MWHRATSPCISKKHGLVAHATDKSTDAPLPHRPPPPLARTPPHGLPPRLGRRTLPRHALHRPLLPLLPHLRPPLHQLAHPPEDRRQPQLRRGRHERHHGQQEEHPHHGRRPHHRLHRHLHPPPRRPPQLLRPHGLALRPLLRRTRRN